MSNDGRGSVAEQLLALAEARATGTLALWRGQIGKQLFIRDGQLVGAESNLREEALGEVLIGLGVLGKSRLPRLLAEVRRRNQKMGAVLVDLGWTTPEVVLQALGEQVRLRARACLRWRASECRFEATSSFVGQVLEYPSPLPDLVFTGLRAHPSFERLVPALDAPVPLEVTPSDRWPRHRREFNELFGSALEEQMVGGIALQSLAVHPDAAPLLEGLEVMLAAGLAELRTDGVTFVVPEPDPREGASVPIWAGPVRPEPSPRVHLIDAELAFTDGKAALAAGKAAAAVPHFERAVELRSDQAAYHAWLGWAVYQAEGPSALPRVVAALRQACDVDPESPEGNRWLGEVLLANGDRSGARVHLERALARGPERALVALLAQIHVDAGEPAQAEKLYMRVITALGEREPRTRAELWRDLAGVLRGSLADEAAAATAEATASELERGSSEGHQGTER